MYSNFKHLKRKTPAGGINRQEFIEHLAEEYHTTTNVEAQEQVTANLANFAYDPINWDYLKQAEVLQLFIETLSSQNEILQLHGIAGLCNICLDTVASKYITQPDNINIIIKLLLESSNFEIHLNCITLFYQLLNNENSDAYKPLLITPVVLKRIGYFRQNSRDKRVTNLCNLFLETFGSRKELIEVQAPELAQKQHAASNLSSAAASLQSGTDQMQGSSIN